MVDDAAERPASVGKSDEQRPQRPSARERRARRGQQEAELLDDYEVEQMVREQLYGRRGRQR